MVQNAADQIQQAQEQLNWHWRNSMRPVRFFNLDARAIFPFFALLFYARLITLFVCIAVTAIFFVVERMGYTLPSALRKLRSLINGDKRPALISMRHRRLKDFY
jgi:intracellular multiplication protein IcmT